MRRARGRAPKQVTLKVNEPISAGGAHYFLPGGQRLRPGDHGAGRRRATSPRTPVPVGLPRAGQRSLHLHRGGQGDRRTGRSRSVCGARSCRPPRRPTPRRVRCRCSPTPATRCCCCRPDTGDLGLDAGVPESVISLDLEGLTEVTGDHGPALARGAAARSERRHARAAPAASRSSGWNGSRDSTVRADPAKGAALVFAVLAMLGLVASLFVPRRRVWARRRWRGPVPGRSIAGAGRRAGPWRGRRAGAGGRAGGRCPVAPPGGGRARFHGVDGSHDGDRRDAGAVQRRARVLRHGGVHARVPGLHRRTCPGRVGRSTGAPRPVRASASPLVATASAPTPTVIKTSDPRPRRGESCPPPRAGQVRTSSTPPGGAGRAAGARGVAHPARRRPVHSAAVLLRGLSAGRAPWGNMYEFAVTGSAVVGLVLVAPASW